MHECGNFAELADVAAAAREALEPLGGLAMGSALVEQLQALSTLARSVANAPLDAENVPDLLDQLSSAMSHTKALWVCAPSNAHHQPRQRRRSDSLACTPLHHA